MEKRFPNRNEKKKFFLKIETCELIFFTEKY